uniref:Uncharacterized protein n=1 Tax=Pediastrum duplex TaxID=3105 RepID=A0A2U8GI38_PEDDU|nr:hypothetical protein [Pediastrum duplex]
MRRLPSHLCFCYFSKAEGCTNAKTHFFFCSLREGGAEMNEAFASVPPSRSEQKKKIVGSAKEPAAISSHLWSRVFAQLLWLFAFASVTLASVRCASVRLRDRSATEPKRRQSRCAPMRRRLSLPRSGSEEANQKKRKKPKHQRKKLKDTKEKEPKK